MLTNRMCALILLVAVSQVAMPWGQKRSMPEMDQVVLPEVREEHPVNLRDTCQKMSEDVMEGCQALRLKLSHAAQAGSDWAGAAWADLRGEPSLDKKRSYTHSISEYDSVPWPIVARLAHATGVTGFSKFAYDRMTSPEGCRNLGKFGQYSVGLFLARYLYLELRNMSNTVRVEWE